MNTVETHNERPANIAGIETRRHSGRSSASGTPTAPTLSPASAPRRKL
jgi:hypothetical protein